jgi:4-amino-4-deoxy-L-arabinose transferase-like glycosyltransferase
MDYSQLTGHQDFPFIISLFYLIFKSNTILILTSFLIVIGSLCGLISYHISLKLFKNRSAALLAFLFICIQPSFLIHSPQLLSDTFAVMLMGISIIYMLMDYENSNKRISIILGVIIGFLVLVTA